MAADPKSAQQKSDEDVRIERTKERVTGDVRVDEGAVETDPQPMTGPLMEKTSNDKHPHDMDIRILDDEQHDMQEAHRARETEITAIGQDEIRATGGITEEQRNEIREARGEDPVSNEDLMEEQKTPHSLQNTNDTTSDSTSNPGRKEDDKSPEGTSKNRDKDDSSSSSKK